MTIVLDLLISNDLVANLKKYQFTVLSVEYLSQVVLIEEVSVDPTKIEAMQKWPQAKNLKEL